MLTRGTYSSQSISRNLDREIQVAGSRIFPSNRWREAILYYLFGVWGGKMEVCVRPKIYFGPVTLFLSLRSEEYFAYTCPDIPPDEADFHPDTPVVINTGKRKGDVEVGLVSFVKDNQKHFLRIHLDRGIVDFWKGEKRSELYIAYYGLPNLTDRLHEIGR